MAESFFRSNLLQKNLKICHEFISKNLQLKDLILIINDLLFASVSVVKNKFPIHPVCLTNVVKNFIGENKNNPSKELLYFVLNYLFQYDFRINDQDILDQVVKKGVPPTAFMSDLEDACQKQKWDEAELIMAQTYIASDNSRGTFDLLVELALQDVPRNGLFIYHILRAYQFQENKSDNWVYTKTIFDQIFNSKLLEPHNRTDATPEKIYPFVNESDDIILLSAISRIWNDEYVRINGYKRELSYWLTELFSNKLLETNLHKVQKIKSTTTISYLKIAETIIKQKKSINEKANELIRLESIRALSSSINLKYIHDLNKQYDNFLV